MRKYSQKLQLANKLTQNQNFGVSRTFSRRSFFLSKPTSLCPAGPGRRLFSERDTVRQCCTLLRNYLEEDNTVTPSKEKFQLIVKPVPSISKKVKGFNKKDHGENLGWRETLVGEVIITEIVD